MKTLTYDFPLGVTVWHDIDTVNSRHRMRVDQATVRYGTPNKNREGAWYEWQEIATCDLGFLNIAATTEHWRTVFPRVFIIQSPIAVYDDQGRRVDHLQLVRTSCLGEDTTKTALRN